jgi:Flp pilus assembly protein TadG
MKAIRLFRLIRIRLFTGDEGGSAIAEMALTFPLFIALLLGAVQLGEVAYASIEVANAARAGAQYSSMNGGGFNDSAGITLAAQNDAYDTYSPKPSQFTVSAVPSCTCSDGISTCTAAAGIYSCGGGKPIVTVAVTTTATYDSLVRVRVPGINIGPTFTLHGYAEQQVLQ